MTDIVPPPDPYWGEWGKPAPDKPEPTDTEADGKAFAVAALIGGAMIALGAFLPWVTSVTPYAVISHSGMDGSNNAIVDGIILLLCGISIASTGIRGLVGSTGSRSQRVSVAIIAIIAGADAGFDMHITSVNASEYSQQYYPQATAYLGPGLYTVIIGAVVAFGGTSLGRR